MTVPKHTPGPWEVDDSNLVWASAAGEYVATTRVESFETIPREQAEANAHLIAAAPELYEALAWYVENDDTNDEGGNEYWLQGLGRARAALAKARGEANG